MQRDAQPLTREDLIDRFHGYGRPRSDGWLVGTELERHLLRPNGHPVPYAGEHGVRWLLERLAPNGWCVELEGTNPIALYREGSSVTLEPGGQFELSTAPARNVGQLEAESRAFVEEVQAAIGDAPIRQVALGYTPYAAIDEIPWVPKGRYVVMREYLAETGKLAHHMMKGTCAVQSSYDFEGEADCARKLRLGMLLGPLTTAIFANSPLTAGEPNGYASFRGHVWTQTDPRRTGFPEAASAFTFERWVDYLLDVPMMFLKGDDGWRPASGVTFRTWMNEGIDGKLPDEAAWELHLTSVFPEVRVKRYIEIRGADCVSRPLAIAFSALWKGLLYDDRALDGATEIAQRFAAEGTSASRFEIACRDGLAGDLGGQRLAKWAEQIVDLAAGGLDRLGDGERAFLRPLVDQVATGESPAAEALRLWKADPRPEALVDGLLYQP